MINPDLVVSTIVTALKSITLLVTQLNGDPENIKGYYYNYGEESSLARAVFEMVTPSILIAYQDMLGGNFDGGTVIKHRVEAYLRPNNTAQGADALGAAFTSTPYLAYLMMNGLIINPFTEIRTTNIRYTCLLAHLSLMETPTLKHQMDENGMDLFCWSMVFPEWGDIGIDETA